VGRERRTLLTLLFIIIGMFGFTFALVPIYDAFCKVTGLNGKVDITNSGIVRYKDPGADTKGRSITVEFDVNRNQRLKCDFSPEHPVLQITPGKLTLTSYYIKNLTDKTLIIQAIPSISPGIAAKHLKKLECFCFNRQTIKPGEALNMPLRFWLEQEMPEEVKRLTLSYTLFDMTEFKKEKTDGT